MKSKADLTQTARLAAFNKLFAAVRRRQRARIRKAGKHKCVKTPTGTARRVTGRGDRILKRPVVIARFYACRICGKDMSSVCYTQRGSSVKN